MNNPNAMEDYFKTRRSPDEVAELNKSMAELLAGKQKEEKARSDASHRAAELRNEQERNMKETAQQLQDDKEWAQYYKTHHEGLIDDADELYEQYKASKRGVSTGRLIDLDFRMRNRPRHSLRFF